MVNGANQATQKKLEERVAYLESELIRVTKRLKEVEDDLDTAYGQINGLEDRQKYYARNT